MVSVSMKRRRVLKSRCVMPRRVRSPKVLITRRSQVQILPPPLFVLVRGLHFGAVLFRVSGSHRDLTPAHRIGPRSRCPGGSPRTFGLVARRLGGLLSGCHSALHNHLVRETGGSFIARRGSVTDAPCFEFAGPGQRQIAHPWTQTECSASRLPGSAYREGPGRVKSKRWIAGVLDHPR